MNPRNPHVCLFQFIAATIFFNECIMEASAAFVERNSFVVGGSLETTTCIPLAFAGGFGRSSSGTNVGSSGKSFSNKTSNKGFVTPEVQSTQKKKRKNKKLGDLDDVFSSPSEPSRDATAAQDAGPLLDRFGLPIPTEDDLFPPLPVGTEILSASASDGEYPAQQELDEILAKHLRIDLFALEKMSAKASNPMKMRILHRSPPVVTIENFFTPDECQYCIDLVSDNPVDFFTDKYANNKKVMKVTSATFSSLAQSKRTSTTWFLNYCTMPTLLAKLTNILNISLEQCEEPQIVRYRSGEEFSWHYDEVPAAQLNNGGQRIATALVYLNTLEENKGGGTVFRDLKSPGNHKGQLTMSPKQGSLLLFFPAFADGTADDRTLHKGEVALDTKMVAQMWIHQRQYLPVVPEGNSHDDAREAIAAKEAELGFRPKD